MSYTFLDLQSEVKRRSTLDQGGTTFDTAVKNLINFSLFRIANEAPWRALRRTDRISTNGDYTTGTVTTVLDSKTWTGSGTSWLTTANATKGRRAKITSSTTASNKLFTIDTITVDTTLTTVEAYNVTGAASLSYKILGQEIYTLPIQTSRPAILWHEAYGYPYAMNFITDRSFFDEGYDFSTSGIPTHYKMWGEDWIINQPKAGSVMRIASSSSADTSKKVTVFGTVSGYPDYEEITTNASNGTTAASGSKTFTSVERITKDSSTTGRITVDADSANTTIAVLPVGDTTGGIMYKKVQLWPPPDATYYINVWYYKEPYRLVNDNDVHELGPDFDELIVLMAAAKLNTQQSKKEAKDFFAMFKDEIRVLRRKNADRLDWLPRLQRHSDIGRGRSGLHKSLSYSQVGQFYGPSSF